ncbi:MAG TPA: SDR family NAD(P)-dependent oxidoreductase, partial [Thermoplasmata archaeon]|nr:SDR family NAD(P)-dependent oxidoreductase [Thermoplasmata archaeon]
MSGEAGAGSNERVAVVTGATSGIGRILAERLAGLGYTTVVVGRGDARAAGAAGEIARATGNTRVASIGVADLAVRSEANRVADEVERRYPAVHLLVNNAGAFYARREVTSEGLERTFALNVLAPYILTNRLVGALERGAPSRVVQVASEAHRAHRVDFDDLEGAREYRGYRQYGRSKLELILLTREFARRLDGSGVTVNAVHPGFIRSGFGRNNGGATSFGIRIAAALFGRSLAHGVETPLDVATNPKLAATTGAYFSNLR